jgi:hypothetical protein
MCIYLQVRTVGTEHICLMAPTTFLSSVSSLTLPEPVFGDLSVNTTCFTFSFAVLLSYLCPPLPHQRNPQAFWKLSKKFSPSSRWQFGPGNESLCRVSSSKASLVHFLYIIQTLLLDKVLVRERAHHHGFLPGALPGHLSAVVRTSPERPESRVRHQLPLLAGRHAFLSSSPPLHQGSPSCRRS